jgi:hypothetical protein
MLGVEARGVVDQRGVEVESVKLKNYQETNLGKVRNTCWLASVSQSAANAFPDDPHGACVDLTVQSVRRGQAVDRIPNAQSSEDLAGTAAIGRGAPV